MNDSTTPAVVGPVMRILKIGTCPSLSGLSEITYQVGTAMDGRDVSDISFRIQGNSNGGKYNPIWISIVAIEKVLAKIPPEQSFTAAVFNPIYIGGSSNSPGFLGAILLAVGLINRAPDSRAYVRHSAPEFFAEMERLLASEVRLEDSTMGKSGSHTAVPSSKSAKQPKKSAQLANA